MQHVACKLAGAGSKDAPLRQCIQWHTNDIAHCRTQSTQSGIIDRPIHAPAHTDRSSELSKNYRARHTKPQGLGVVENSSARREQGSFPPSARRGSRHGELESGIRYVDLPWVYGDPQTSPCGKIHHILWLSDSLSNSFSPILLYTTEDSPSVPLLLSAGTPRPHKTGETATPAPSLNRRGESTTQNGKKLP